MTDFVDLADGGAQLAALVRARGLHCDHIVGVVPNGLPAAHAVAQVLDCDVISAMREGVDGSFVIDGTIHGSVMVCDDGVETGRAALTLGQQLRDMGAAPLVLAVPICPREIEPSLRQVYDDIVAVVRPLARRALSWHYERL